jgi:hypothetical protein
MSFGSINPVTRGLGLSCRAHQKQLFRFARGIVRLALWAHVDLLKCRKYQLGNAELNIWFLALDCTTALQVNTKRFPYMIASAVVLGSRCFRPNTQCVLCQFWIMSSVVSVAEQIAGYRPGLE